MPKFSPIDYYQKLVYWIMQFKSFYCLSLHCIWAITPWSAGKCGKHARDFWGRFYFYVIFVFYSLEAFLITQLFNSRLLDMKWL